VPPRQPELRVELRPAELAVYGLQAAEVLETVNAHFTVRWWPSLSQADRSVPVAVRIATADATPQAVGELLLRARDGALVPLSASRISIWFRRAA